jgi:hypothetical protein
MTDKRATVAGWLVFLRRSSAPLRTPRASERRYPEAESTTLTTLAAVSSQMEKIAMTSMRQFVLAAGLLGLCAIAVELLTHGGSLAVPKTERTALRGERAAVHGELERLESVVPAGRSRDNTVWRAYLDLVGKELEQGHIDGAVRVWHDAYGAALESGSWESMIAVGDAFMNIGRASGTPGGARMNAREAYLTALIRARRDHSVDGALRSAEAFRQLGDRSVVEQSLHVAGQLAAGDEQAQAKVREAQQR